MIASPGARIQFHIATIFTSVATDGESAKSYERAANQSSIKMRGLYRRGKIFWCAKMVVGKRIQINLGTGDQGAAVANLLATHKERDLMPIPTFAPTRENASLSIAGKHGDITAWGRHRDRIHFKIAGLIQ